MEWSAAAGVVTAISTFALAVAGIVYTIATVGIWSATQRSVVATLDGVQTTLQSIRQETATARFRLAADQNWAIYDRRGQLPPVLPAWKGLNDKQWGWRVMHLNHLNLLQFAWEEHKEKRFSSAEFAGWSRMGKSWFRHLTGQDPDIVEGRSQLWVILRDKNGYQEGFLDWLLKEILPEGLPDE